MSSHVGCEVYHPMASMGTDMPSPQPNICVTSDVYSYYTLPGVFTHLQWMLPVDIHSRSHNFLLIHSQGSLTGGTCRVTSPATATLVVHHPIFTSFGSRLAWGGAGTSVPCMTDTYTQGNANL